MWQLQHVGVLVWEFWYVGVLDTVSGGCSVYELQNVGCKAWLLSVWVVVRGGCGVGDYGEGGRGE